MVTYAVGFGVGLGVPSILGIGFAAAFGTLGPLLLPLVFGLVLFLAWIYRTIGYRVNPDAIMVLRPAGSKSIETASVESICFPASHPPGLVFGLWRVDGFFGNQGTYWNKVWGKFHVYVTNEQNTVEILLKDGRRILVSPDDPAQFLHAVQAVTLK